MSSVAKGKPNLTADQWREIGHKSREARAALHRVIKAVGLSESKVACQRWLGFQGKLNHQNALLFTDVCEGEYGIPRTDGMRKIPEIGFDGLAYPWATTLEGRPDLTRAEWVVVGDDVKQVQAMLSGIAFTLQASSDHAWAQTWFDLADAVKLLKSKLDGTVCRQHPTWKEATHVFYGEPSRNNLALRSSITEPSTLPA